MKKEEFIKLARKAGFVHGNPHSEIIVRHSSGAWVSIEERLHQFAILVAAAEREACAKVCDEQATRSEASMEKSRTSKARDVYSAAGQTAHWMAAAIRARSQK